MCRWTIFFFLSLAFLSACGCAVHYFDAANNTEHIWGVGHMAMKIAAPNEGVKAVASRTDVVGVALGSLQKDVHLELGWGARQRIEIVDANTELLLAWPRGSFSNARFGSKFPFDPEHLSDSEATEE